MCRFLAYHGAPVLMDSLITAPCHSLIHQSLHAAEGKTETNSDGFGVGWFGERDAPGLYREVRPACSDENLRSIAAQMRSGTFFAHVRAATGTATSRANCHPFAHGRSCSRTMARWAVADGAPPDGSDDPRRSLPRPGRHDGQRGGVPGGVGQRLATDPVGAVRDTLARVKAAMQKAGVAAPLRFTATLTDGDTLWAFRWSCDGRPPSLYYKQDATGLRLVSEPIDGQKDGWRETPRGFTLTARRGEPVTLEPGMMELVRAA